MTRINSNVSSLVAQNTLGRSNADLNQALTRLSTGLRINTGKDDPAGLIASENLRSDITAIGRAISNTSRANQVIATADSALGQVSGLLNDIRGLVVESANTGVLSQDQIDANQLQVDSSLEALNRIAQTTTFQGRKLLDGSLNFLTTAGTGFGTVTNLEIDQVNLGTSPTLSVTVSITAAATQAQLTNNSITAAVAGVQASDTLTFTDAAVSATGNVDIDLVQRESTGSTTLTSGVTAITFTTLAGGAAAGATGAALGGVDLIITDSNDASGDVTSASYNAGTNELTIDGDITGGLTTLEIETFINGDVSINTVFSASGGDASVLTGADVATYTNVSTGGRDASTETIAVTSTAGAAGNITINLVEANNGGGATVVDNGGGSYTIEIDNVASSVTIQAIRAAILTIAEVSGSVYAGSASYFAADDAPPAATDSITGGLDATQDVITVTADVEGTAANGVTVSIVEAAAQGAPTAAIVSGNIVVTTDTVAATTITQINNAINGLAGYSATITDTSGDDTYINGTDNAATGTLAGGADALGGLAESIVFEVAGSTGAEVLSFGANTSITIVVAAINQVSDATGVSATDSGGILELNSTAYGSAAFVSVDVLIGDTSGTFAGGLSGVRDEGTDIVAAVNGITAKGLANSLSINTATLDLSMSVDPGSSTDVVFTITGGGALFQLGPEVVSNQQARIGITSVNTARLGGASGKLFQLGTGGTADLNTDTTTAALIIEEAIDQITTLRGRLGAFQRTTLETNKNALNDVLINLTDAESLIRDADFAAESAALTRAQILVQSGTTVLQIANSNPQNVLALLR